MSFDATTVSVIIAVASLAFFIVWSLCAAGKKNEALLELRFSELSHARVTAAEQADLNRMQNLASLAGDPDLARKFRQFAKVYWSISKSPSFQPAPRDLGIVLECMTDAMRAGKNAGSAPPTACLEQLHETADAALSYLAMHQENISAEREAKIEAMMAVVSKCTAKT